MHSDALIERARVGEREAQGKLVQLWYKRIYNYAHKFLMDHDRAMEATQRTFISMCQNLPSLQETGRFKSWLYKIAVNYCREEYRRQAARRSVPLDFTGTMHLEESPAWEPAARPADNPDRVLQQRELADTLQQCLLELSDEQREVVVMKEYEGLKFREIADVLSISENTAKSRLYYGLHGLRKILEKRNININEMGYEG